LTPLLASQPDVVARLRRNALIEVGLGVCVLAVAAALGVSVPALHAKIIWPFPWTLEWSALARPREIVPAAAFFLVLALAIAAYGAIRGRFAAAAGGAILFVGTALAFSARLVVPAHPTTYFEPPVPYGVASVLRGEHQNRYRGEPHIATLGWEYPSAEFFLKRKIAGLADELLLTPREADPADIQNWSGIGSSRTAGDRSASRSSSTCCVTPGSCPATS